MKSERFLPSVSTALAKQKSLFLLFILSHEFIYNYGISTDIKLPLQAIVVQNKDTFLSL